MGILQKVIGIAVALLVLFLLASTLILPQFSSSYNPTSCSATNWIDNSTYYASDCSEYATSIGSASVIQNSTPQSCPDESNFCCLGCSNWSFRTTSRGMILLVLVIALIGLGLYFLPKR